MRDIFWSYQMSLFKVIVVVVGTFTNDLLLLLDGQLVHLPAPKSHYAKDIVFDKDTSILATGKNEIIFVKSGAIDDKETEMMAVRWKINFVFMRRFHSSNRKKFRPKCFAILVLGGDSDWQRRRDNE